jgi:DNA-3-methyladenine glycosylase II
MDAMVPCLADRRSIHLLSSCGRPPAFRLSSPLMSAGPPTLTQETLALAVHELAARDPDLGGIVERFGPPPMWERSPGFPTLVHIVLEQQVSLASAQAAFDRLRAVGELAPSRFLELHDEQLLAIGFSRQKSRYVMDLARAVKSGSLDLEGLGTLADEEVRRAMVALTGIGPWTASIYLLMALRRPDVWPANDLALVTSVTAVKRLERRPNGAQMEALAEPWRPWRSVAARLLWHDYLSRRGSLPRPAV